jgi:hypothetical protein
LCRTDGDRTDCHQARTAGEGELGVDGVENGHRQGVADRPRDRIQIIACADKVQGFR